MLFFLKLKYFLKRYNPKSLYQMMSDINNDNTDNEIIPNLLQQLEISNDQISPPYRNPELEQLVQEIIESPPTPTLTPSPGMPIAQVIWTDHWERLGTSFAESDNIPTWFWNLEEDTYDKLTLKTDDNSTMRYALTQPVIGKLIA